MPTRHEDAERTRAHGATPRASYERDSDEAILGHVPRAARGASASSAALWRTCSSQRSCVGVRVLRSYRTNATLLYAGTVGDRFQLPNSSDVVAAAVS